MAKTKLPDPLRRRHLVEGGVDPGRALQLAEAYLEQGRSIEAVAFLLKAEAREQLVALREQAVGEGDAFLLREVTAALGEDIDAASWHALAEAADAAGKDRYAGEARRQAARLED